MCWNSAPGAAPGGCRSPQQPPDLLCSLRRRHLRHLLDASSHCLADTAAPYSALPAVCGVQMLTCSRAQPPPTPICIHAPMHAEGRAALLPVPAHMQRGRRSPAIILKNLGAEGSAHAAQEAALTNNVLQDLALREVHMQRRRQPSPATFSRNLALRAAEAGRRQAARWRSLSSASSLASRCRSRSTFPSSSIATFLRPCSQRAAHAADWAGHSPHAGALGRLFYALLCFQLCAT